MYPNVILPTSNFTCFRLMNFSSKPSLKSTNSNKPPLEPQKLKKTPGGLFRAFTVSSDLKGWSHISKI